MNDKNRIEGSDEITDLADAEGRLQRLSQELFGKTVPSVFSSEEQQLVMSGLQVLMFLELHPDADVDQQQVDILRQYVGPSLAVLIRMRVAEVLEGQTESYDDYSFDPEYIKALITGLRLVGGEGVDELVSGFSADLTRVITLIESEETDDEVLSRLDDHRANELEQTGSDLIKRFADIATLSVTEMSQLRADCDFFLSLVDMRSERFEEVPSAAVISAVRSFVETAE